MFSSSAAISTLKMRSVTYTSSTTWIAPAGVINLVSVSGYGGMGYDAFSTTTYTWDRYQTRYYYGRNGQTSSQFTGQVVSGSGNAPADYCDPLVDTPDDPNYYANQYCYAYTEYSNTTDHPAGYGPDTTGFSRTFPGSYGATGPTATTFTNITVTAGGSYPLTVPSGGSITITYLG